MVAGVSGHLAHFQEERVPNGTVSEDGGWRCPTWLGVIEKVWVVPQLSV